MKKIYLAMLFASLGIMSANSYADKIVISGSPVVVEKQGEYYVPSTTVTTSSSTMTSVSDPYFVSVNNTKQVCYKEVQPALAKIDLGIMAFKMGSDTVSMHCYSYSPDYFVVPVP